MSKIRDGKSLTLLFGPLLALAGCEACAPPAAPPPTKEDAGPPVDEVAEPVALSVSPATVDLQTDGLTQPTQAFTVALERADGSISDVTDRAYLALEHREVGTLDGATFVSNGAAGEVVLTARHEGLAASSTIVVRHVEEILVPPPAGEQPVPEGVSRLVDEAPRDPARAPAIVYPADGTLMPPNLRGVEVHFTRGNAANTLYAVSFSSDGFLLRVFMRCAPLSTGCAYAPAPEIWDLVTSRHRGGAPVQVRVTGIDETGSVGGDSTEIALSFTWDKIDGGLYYWTVSNGTAIMRVDFAGDAQEPELFLSGGDTHCIGCHAISPDGYKMSLSKEGQASALALVDIEELATTTPPLQGLVEQYQAWSPDSRFFATTGFSTQEGVLDTAIRVRDANSGEVVETIDVGGIATHPDWSSTGDRIYFTSVPGALPSRGAAGGSISFVERASGAWTGPFELVPAAPKKSRFYPSASPDGSVLVFDESSCFTTEPGPECDGISDPNAKLWAVPAAGGAPVLLANANAVPPDAPSQPSLTNSWPRWAPFHSRRAEGGSAAVYWLAFSSQRPYGLHGAPAQRHLVWMAAVDVDAVLAGEDGSFPAFLLPMQDIATSNHVPQWTRKVVGKPDIDP